MEDLTEIFKDEAAEILQSIESDIVNLEENEDPEVINKIFRNIHTLKGSSGIAGLTKIYEFTHKLENLFDAVRSDQIHINETLIDILLDSIDIVKVMAFEEDKENNIDDISRLVLNRISEFQQSQPGPIQKKELNNIPKENEAISEANDAAFIKKNIDAAVEEINLRLFRIKANFNQNIFENGIDPLMLIEELFSLGRIFENRVNRKNLPDFEKIDPEKCYISWDIIIRTDQSIDRIKEIFLFVIDDNDILITDISDSNKNKKPVEIFKEKMLGEIMMEENMITENDLNKVLEIQSRSKKKFAEIAVEKGYATEKDIQFALEVQQRLKQKVETSTVRVATNKLDNLLNLLGEIVISQSTITRVADELGGEESFKVKNAVYGLDRITREFQEQIMAIRMIPIGPSFEQFRRFVRDTAKEYGKKIKFFTSGGETNLDKTVIEKIGDPLKHMIRNCIDHGIETPEERKAIGKSGNGTVRLIAYHQEGNVYIEITDDGKGIDWKMINQKAELQGFALQGDSISKETLKSFIFAPGFSTAEKVGALSGRGVGMDVVKNNIDALRGTIDIITKKGKGTTFKIKLPLTLAIIDGMLVRVGDTKYVIPLLSIVESIQPTTEELKTVEGKGEVIYIRGEYVSFVRLYELFDIEPDFKDPKDCLVVIVESNNINLGIMVDELIGQQQIVIKSFDTQISKNRAISGASILGDGKISLILDIHGLAAEIAS